jgi:OOP family OmpA-OmpF porin
MNKTPQRVLTALATACLSTLAAAQVASNEGYIADAQRSIVVSGTGLCWHDGSWNSTMPVEPCDPAKKPFAVAPAVMATPTPAAPAPVAVAAAAQAAPVPAARVEAAAPLSRRISFSGDALFAFDKSELKPEGIAMLDDLVRRLGGATFGTILATGHTDRIGTDAYNLKLSQRRAQAVKDYLVSKKVDAGRIDAEGKGEAQPVTSADQCKGGMSAKLVACLQPDRRVDVEMTGSVVVTGR